MTADALLLLNFMFKYIWKFFNSWYIPGTNVTPAAMAFFILASAMIIKIVKTTLLGGAGDGD